MTTKFANIFLLFCAATIMSSCSEKVGNKLVATSNLKKSGIKEDNLYSIDSLLGSALINNWTAGATALVTKNQEVIYYKGFGFKDRENKVLMAPMDLFRIASMTKPIVSVAALQLVEEGKLNLEDPVSKYIPQFKNPHVLASFNEADTTYTSIPANTEITIKNLLTHTSGIGYGIADKRLKLIYEKNNIPDLATTQKLTLDSVMQKLGGVPLGVQPNSKFYYGLNTDVLGRVIEVASGKPLDSVLIKKIFEPLGMNDTHFFLPPQKTRRLATMYSETKEGRLIRTEPVQGKNNINFPISGAKTYLSGGSGLVSNIDDYAKFLQMILNKGTYAGKTILKPETVDLMCSNQIGSLIVGKGNKFGLGFEIAAADTLENKAKPGKLSWGGVFNTMFWIDPERKSIAILMTQVYPAIHKTELYNKFETLVNRALDEEPKKKK